MEHIRLRKPGARYLYVAVYIFDHHAERLADWMSLALQKIDQAFFLVSVFYGNPTNRLANGVTGDGILVRAQDTPDGKWFEGLVVDVRAEEVALQFQGSFARWTPSRAYAVRFNFNRYPLRRQHQALNRPFNDERVFFPITKDVKQLSAYVVDVEPYNPLIGNNPAQMLAIRAILRLPPGSHPFIIYGPYVCLLQLFLFHNASSLSGLVRERPRHVLRQYSNY